MRYFDASGTPISAERWRQLYVLDREYSTRRRTLVPGGHVETSWVGVAVGGERVPRLFLVQVLPEGLPRTWPDDRGGWWFATEAEAVALHEKLVSELVTAAECQGR